MQLQCFISASSTRSRQLRNKFDYLGILGNARLSLCIENNATGQFSRLMRAETGYKFDAGINKYDGRPFTLEGLSGELDAHISKL